MSVTEMTPLSPQPKLLEEYLFLSIEEETEEMVVEKYSRLEMEYTMKIEKKEGKKHGATKLVSMDGCVVAELTFDQGDLTGPFTLYSSEGKISFRGFLKDGVRTDFGQEYDDQGHIIFEGMFENGSKKVVQRERHIGRLSGYFEERTSNNDLLNISQRRRNTMIKEGWSIDFSMNDEVPVSKKWYVNGEVKWEKVHVDGTVITERDEEGHVVYKGGFKYFGGYFFRWGEGVEYESSGAIRYKGEFKVGVYHGEGTLYQNNKKYVEGRWEYGYPEGEGILYDDETESKKLEGIWKLGYLDGIDYLTGRRREI